MADVDMKAANTPMPGDEGYRSLADRVGMSEYNIKYDEDEDAAEVAQLKNMFAPSGSKKSARTPWFRQNVGNDHDDFVRENGWDNKPYRPVPAPLKGIKLNPISQEGWAEDADRLAYNGGKYINVSTAAEDAERAALEARRTEKLLRITANARDAHGPSKEIGPGWVRRSPAIPPRIPCFPYHAHTI